jgi:hypothetical protein
MVVRSPEEEIFRHRHRCHPALREDTVDLSRVPDPE